MRAHISKTSGQATILRHDWERMEPYHLAAQQTFQGWGGHLGTAECVRNRTTRYLQRGMLHKAEVLCEQALEWALRVNEDELRATVLHTLAAIKSIGGELADSIKILKLCLADLRTIGNATGQGHILLNIGYHQRHLGDYQAATISLNEALNIALEKGDLWLAALCYMNISRCFLAQNDLAQVRSTIAGARRILPELNSPATEAELNLLERKVLLALGEIKDADALLKKTYQLTTQHNLTELLADVQFEEGVVQIEMGDMQTAACKLVAAAQQYRQLGIDDGYQAAIEILDRLKKAVDDG